MPSRHRAIATFALLAALICFFIADVRTDSAQEAKMERTVEASFAALETSGEIQVTSDAARTALESQMLVAAKQASVGRRSHPWLAAAQFLTFIGLVAVLWAPWQGSSAAGRSPRARTDP